MAHATRAKGRKLRYLLALLPALAAVLLTLSVPGEIAHERVEVLNEHSSGGGSSVFHGLGKPDSLGKHLGGALPPATPGGVESWEVTPAFPFIEIDEALAITPAPRSDKLYVGTRSGIVYAFDNDANATQRDVFLDLFDKTAVVWDGGFLGLAFHPDFGDSTSPNRGYLYVYYCARNPGASYPTGATGGFYNIWCHLSRFTVPDGSTTADPASELIMMKFRLINSSHRGGGLAFGHDGYLYLTVGEMFTQNWAQNTVDNLYGGIHRIDVDMDLTRSHPPVRTYPVPGGGAEEFSGVGYYIPNDNPFLDPTGSRFEEYYTLGNRAPHRLAVDPATGRMWVGEIGSSLREEINVVVAGANYGWPFREGFTNGPGSTPPTIQGTLTDPVVDFVRSEANAIIGGYVYRGTRFPTLVGKYICGGYSQDRIWAIDYDEASGTGTKEYLCQFTPENLYTFGQDLAGEIYLGGDTPDNRLYQLQGVGSTEPPPGTLSATGAFTNLTTLEPAPGIIPYGLNVPFWSDGAIKFRWMAIPNDGDIDMPTERITFTENEEWTFPAGSVLIKHFDLRVDDTDPSVTRHIETRFLVHGDDGDYYGLSYQWLPDESDAVLVGAAGLDVPVTIATATGTRQQVWHYPSRSECLTCHNQAAGHVLGPKTRQLNGPFTYPRTGITDNQLRALNHIGLLSPPLDGASLPDLLTSFAADHPSATIEDKARSYIDSNCAACHRPGTGNRALFDARLSTPLELQGLVNGEVLDNLGILGGRVLAPLDTAASIAHLRMGSLDPAIMMPPLAKGVVDTAGMALLESWIASMEPDADFDPLAIGLVGWWQLDEGPPSAIAYDASREQNTGLLMNIESDDWVEGRIGYGVEFDGVDEYLEVPNEIELEVGKNGADFSVAFWMFLEEGSTGAWRSIAHKGAVDADRTFALWMHPDEDRLQVRVTTTAGDEGVDSQGALTPGAWAHVALVKRDSMLSLYVDGLLDAETSLIGATTSNTGPLYVGDTPWNDGVHARIDDVRIYGRALDASQVSALAAPSGALACWLRLDETSGTTALDATGRGHAGTWNGLDGTWTTGQAGGGLDMGVDARVDVAASPALRFGDGDGAYTVAVWIRLQSSAAGFERVIVQQGDYDQQRLWGLRLGANDDRVTYRIKTIAHWNEGGTSQSELALDAWTHLAMVKEPGLLSLYVDGALESTASLLGPTYGDELPIYLGDVPFYSLRGVDAVLDDVRLYPRALSSDEVAALVSSPDQPGLAGAYYDDVDFTNLVLTRVDPVVDFDWGTGSPDPVLGPETFSVRWTGSVSPLFDETYTFYTRTDDGARLWVNDQLLVDAWVDQSPTEHAGAIALSSDVPVPLRMEMFENGGGAVAELRWSSPSQVKEIVPQDRLSTSVPLVPGLLAEYYDEVDLTNLTVTRIEPVVDFDWGNGSPDPAIGANTFSCRWSGFVVADYTDTYTFYTESDDGIRLWVDGALVIDEWNDHAATEHAGNRLLTAGQPVPIRLEHYEAGGQAVARLSWSATAVPKAIIPASNLFPGGMAVRDSRPSGTPGVPALALFQNHPNPFNPATTIRYALPDRRRVDLRVFAVTGQLVRTLVAENVPAGTYAVIWDGLDEHRRPVASGVYYYRLRAGDADVVRRMTLIR